MKIRIIAIAAIAIFGFIVEAKAWGPEGHRLVGSIADQLLTANARAQVQRIMGRGITLRIAGPWLDCVRSVDRDKAINAFRYFHSKQYGEKCTEFEGSEGHSQEQFRMEDYVRRNWSMCSYKDGNGACSDTYHFADVPIKRNEYSRSHFGTNDRDVVQSINAAIRALRCDNCSITQPISIADKKEALFILAHLVGDLHQPLHVGSVYLDPKGNLIDPPDGSIADEKADTRGGNSVYVDDKILHSAWDATPQSLGGGDDAKSDGELMQRARKVPATSGPLEEAAAMWATQSILEARKIFDGATFQPRPSDDDSLKWNVVFPSSYAANKEEVQKQQMALAGAHLAELLNAIWR